MNLRPVYLIDSRSSIKVAALDVRLVGDHFEGTISLDVMPPQLTRLFEEFEEIVEGQMFSLLDDIERKIGEAPLRILFDNGGEAEIADLQVFPSTGAVSFEARQTMPIRLLG